MASDTPARTDDARAQLLKRLQRSVVALVNIDVDNKGIVRVPCPLRDEVSIALDEAIETLEAASLLVDPAGVTPSEAEQQRLAVLEAFARDCAENYDHDNDAHRYNTHCRVCEAEKALLAPSSPADKEP